jgi:hypothetical protein
VKRTPESLVDDYLRRLERELADLPRARRREVVEEIAGHIEEARAEPEARGDVGTLNVLERLGDPAEIAADARARFEIEPRRAGRSEVAALVLLLVGGFVFAVGWLVGLVLLWSSEVWSLRDKLIGTLVFPGGLALPLVLAMYPSYATACSDSGGSGAPVKTTCTTYGAPSTLAHVAWIALAVALVAGPFLTTAYLAWRMRTRSKVALA